MTSVFATEHFCNFEILVEDHNQLEYYSVTFEVTTDDAESVLVIENEEIPFVDVPMSAILY